MNSCIFQISRCLHGNLARIGPKVLEMAIVQPVPNTRAYSIARPGLQHGDDYTRAITEEGWTV